MKKTYIFEYVLIIKNIHYLLVYNILTVVKFIYKTRTLFCFVKYKNIINNVKLLFYILITFIKLIFNIFNFIFNNIFIIYKLYKII